MNLNDLLKKYYFTILVSACAFVLGLLLLVVRRHWIILRWIPASSIGRGQDSRRVSDCPITRKSITIYSWKDGQPCIDKVRCIWGKEVDNNIKNLVGHWLAFNYEERVISKRVQLESVALDESGQSVILSFDRPLLEREWAIYKKWNLITSLLETIRPTSNKIQDVLFLVRQEVMKDDHLEFSKPLAL